MIKIEEIKAISYSKAKEGLVKTYRIQEEIFEYENYLSLSFLNSENKEIQIETDKLWRTNLTEFRFSRDELKFLSKIYEFKLAERKWGDKYILTASNNEINPLYGLGGDILLVEDNNKEYAIIRFRRWENENQPQGPNEDMLGENVTYIHGIWENPLLTDEIINKIKSTC